MHITSTRGTYALNHGGVTYEPVQGFVFDVPYELGNQLLTMSDALGPFWRLPEQDDYDLDEQIAAPGPKRTAPKPTRKPAVRGVPPVTGQ